VVINDTPNNMQHGSVDLRPGLHDIRLSFEDLDGFSHMYLYWQPPTMNDKYIIPSLFLLPNMSTYPETPASGAWPTIEQADDTVWARAAANPAADTTQSPPPGNSPPESQPTAFPGSVIKPNLLIGGPGTANLPLPRAVAADPDGNIYIYTETNSRITKYAPDGHKVTDWAAAEADGRPVTEGAALLVKGDRLYFLDATSSTLTSYDLDGKEEGRVLICGCYFPRGLAFANDGNLWAADTGLAHIFKVDLRGQTLTTIGEQGSGPGQFVEPASVWESPQGILFVADVGNHRMQTFTSDGKPLAQWPIGQGTSRDNNRITGTPDGDVLVTEYTSRAIVEYDSRGTEKHRWTYAPAGVSLVPAGIAPYGEGKYVVLFPFDNSAIVLDITQK
jgi:sugar lactone lactonase YvrE